MRRVRERVSLAGKKGPAVSDLPVADSPVADSQEDLEVQVDLAGLVDPVAATGNWSKSLMPTKTVG